MSQENVEIVRRVIMGNSSDGPADDVLSLLHPDFEFISVLGAVDQETYRGREGVDRYRQDMSAAWKKWTIEIDDVVEVSPGTVVATIRPHLVAQSGIPLDGARGIVCELVEGKLLRARTYASHAEALEAVGLSE